MISVRKKNGGVKSHSLFTHIHTHTHILTLVHAYIGQVASNSSVYVLLFNLYY